MSLVPPSLRPGHSNGSSTGFSKQPSAWSNPGLPSGSGSGDDGERHEDGGPVPSLQRSNSGRLPPAYRASWDAQDPPPPHPDVAMSVGGYGSDVGEGPSAPPQVGSPGGLMSPGVSQYPRDVKLPTGPPS